MPDEEKDIVNASTCDQGEELALMMKLGADEESLEDLRDKELKDIQEGED